MKQINHISIPKPCSQSWDGMLPADGGKFCQSCQKTVTDFSDLTNNQILDILSSSNKVCGRFGETQLMVLNHEIAPRNTVFFWQKIGLAAAITGLIPWVNVPAKARPVLEQRDAPNFTSSLLADTPVVYQKITGHIVASEDKTPLPGAMVRIKGTQQVCIADANGNFTLNVPTAPGNVLVVAYIGYQTQEIKLDATKGVYEMQLRLSGAWLGEVVVKRPPVWKRPYYGFKRLMHKIFG